MNSDVIRILESIERVDPMWSLTDCVELAKVIPKAIKWAEDEQIPFSTALQFVYNEANS